MLEAHQPEPQRSEMLGLVGLEPGLKRWPGPCRLPELLVWVALSPMEQSEHLAVSNEDAYGLPPLHPLHRPS